MRNTKNRLILGVLGFFLAITAAFGGDDGTIYVYSSRNNAADRKVYQDFTDAMGINVAVVTGKADELIEKLADAGAKGNADLFVTVDGGVLHAAKKAGIFQKTLSPAIMKNVPARYRDRDDCWVGLTTRARVLVYAKDRVSPSELSTYAALRDPKWKGKVLTRSSSVLYNQSLLASLMTAYGEREATKFACGVAANLARDPKGNDRDQAKAVAAGVGDVAIMNTYYLGHMLNSEDPEEVKAAESVGVFFPDQDGAGTHINVCGIGLTASSRNPEAALRLVEYLVSRRAQEKLSAGNHEFPVNPEAELPELLKSWGEFKAQDIDFSLLGINKPAAVALMKLVGWQ